MLGECFLRHVLGGMMVANDRPCDGMDQPLVPPDQFGIRRRVPAEDLADEKLIGLRRVHFQRHYIALDEARQ